MAPLNRIRSLAGATIVVLALAGCTSGGGGSSKGASYTPEPPVLHAVDEWAPTKGPFAEPPAVYSKDGELKYTLTADDQLVELGGSPIKAVAYNGTFIGPTMYVNPGDTMDLTLVNHLDEPTNLHFHGFHVSPSGNSDNIFLHVMPGESQQYHVVLPPDHDPGLFWYHSHMHEISEGQVFGGLSGMIVIGGLEKLLPTNLQTVEQKLFALKDVDTDADNPDQVNTDPGSVEQNSTRLVNGVLDPTIDIRPGETQLWRIANIGANTFYKISLAGVPFHIIAEDGNPVWNVTSSKTLILPPGKRFEVLVQGPDPGSYPLKTVKGFAQSTAATIPVSTFATMESAGAAMEPAKLPTALVDRSEALDNATIAKKRTEVFDISPKPGTNGQEFQFTINGKVFDPDRIDVTAKLGTVEEWKLVNTSEDLHPFHIHINDFQVMSVNGKPYHANGLQDVVTIPIGGEVVIRNPFNDFTGEYVFHCHVLGHEDRGMMATVNVVK